MQWNKLLFTACLLAASILPLVTVAQRVTRPQYSPASERLQNYTSNSSPTTNRQDPGGNPDVPIDGGISLLVAAGVALGAKKAHAKRKANKAQEAL
jgi:hypothetical protein